MSSWDYDRDSFNNEALHGGGIIDVELNGEVESTLRGHELMLRSELEPFKTLMDSDKFGIFKNINYSEVQNSRVVDETEGLVKLLAGQDRKLTRQHKKAKSKGGKIELPDLHVRDLISLRLSATYEKNGKRTYNLCRSDKYRDETEGFTIVRNVDGSVLVKTSEITSSIGDDEAQVELFKSAQAFIRGYAGAKGFRSEFLIDVGQDKKEVPAVKRQSLVKSLGRKAAEYLDVVEIPSGLKSYLKIFAITQITLFPHTFFTNPDAKISIFPMPLPVELIVDWNNAEDHAAQGFEEPAEGLRLSLNEGITGGTIPEYQLYDTDDVPALLMESSEVFGDGKTTNLVKPGLYSLNLNEDNDATKVCDTLRGDFLDKEIIIFTQDNRIAGNEDFKVEMNSRNAITICNVKEEPMPLGADIFVFQKDYEPKEEE